MIVEGGRAVRPPEYCGGNDPDGELYLQRFQPAENGE